MIWQDIGYLLSKIKYSENGIIADFFTESRGKVTGLIFGATSKKIKNYLLIGNRFHLNYNAKNDSKIGNFKIEVDKITTPFFLDNKQKLSCIVYSINLIKILSADNQKNLNIFNLINELYILLDFSDWIQKFIIWELDVLKSFGYQLNIIDYATRETKDGKDIYYLKNDQNRKIPNFLVNSNDYFADNSDLIAGLNLVGDFLKKSIFMPNNINFPNSRIDFLNTIDLN